MTLYSWKPGLNSPLHKDMLKRKRRQSTPSRGEVNGIARWNFGERFED